MPKIDFYILTTPDPKNRFSFVCRLVEKAYKNRHRLYIHTQSEKDAHMIDELLWTYREDSFLPHNLLGEGPTPPPPIQIGFGASAENHKDILINLSDTVPVFYNQFARILQIISNETQAQEIGREHYRYYRAQGHNITTHKLETTIE